MTVSHKLEPRFWSINLVRRRRNSLHGMASGVGWNPSRGSGVVWPVGGTLYAGVPCALVRALPYRRTGPDTDV